MSTNVNLQGFSKILEIVESKIKEADRMMKAAEADGNSDYDYHQGRLDAYEHVLANIQKLP
jgi:hypothetical protein